MTHRIRVVIADDRSQSRDGMKALLATWACIQVVGEVAGGRDAVRLIEELSPDVVLMDVRMPGMDGIEATRAIKGLCPAVRVVAVTLYEEYRDDAMSAGADAFLVKGCPPEDLIAAILDREAGTPE
jgi:DNA-binding NarL/FixJ family response regulator